MNAHYMLYEYATKMRISHDADIAFYLQEMNTIHTKRHRRLVEILRAARRNNAMSQQELAAKLRTSQTAITRMERHGRRIDVIEFLILCDELILDPVKLIRKIQAVPRD